MGRKRIEPSQSDTYKPVFFTPEFNRVLTSFTVSGEPARKSNSRKVVRIGGKIRVIKSEKALAYGDLFALQVPAEARQGWGSRDQLLGLVCHVFYASYRPDLSVELILDLLQETGVITNDRWIRAIFAVAHVDKQNPRAEITLFELPKMAI